MGELEYSKVLYYAHVGANCDLVKALNYGENEKTIQKIKNDISEIDELIKSEKMLNEIMEGRFKHEG